MCKSIPHRRRWAGKKQYVGRNENDIHRGPLTFNVGSALGHLTAEQNRALKGLNLQWLPFLELFGSIDHLNGTPMLF